MFGTRDACLRHGQDARATPKILLRVLVDLA
jgi:hypothetical protein